MENKLRVSKNSIACTTGRGKKRTNKKAFIQNPCGSNKCIEYKRIIRANNDKKDSKTKPYFIFEFGINLTPKALADAEYISSDAFVQQSKALNSNISPVRSRTMLFMTSVDSVKSGSSVTYSLTDKSSRFSIRKSIISQKSSYSAASLDVWAKENISFIAAADENDREEELISSRAPSMYRLREDPHPRKLKDETHFKINLVETDTIFLLQLPSESVSIETEYGKEISDSNAAYERYLERNKALSHIAMQTTKIVEKHRKQWIPRNNRNNAEAFVSVWDMYDTYEGLKVRNLLAASETSMLTIEGKVNEIDVDMETIECESSKLDHNEKVFNRKLLNALMVMERLVIRDMYCANQLLYQGLLVQDPFSTDVQFNYSLTHLWTFNYQLVKNRSVTSMSWNEKNQNILAVGYGKFRFTAKCDGLVCIWNVKNPSFPERSFEFSNDPVSFVTFSNYRWQILAVSFYSGSVLLIDIIARSTLVKASNHHYPLYYPVRQARWFPPENNTTVLITCGKGGRVYRYKKNDFFISNKIMSLGRPHGNIHGVEQPRKCFSRKVLASRQPSAEVLVRHPEDPQIYFLGSSEGCVYVCSVQHRHEHIEIFMAHNGPVYNIQFNPFCSKVFLTCGGDCCIRIWADNIFQPLITLENGMMAVQDALWSPLHSTVIVSITGTFIELWDIRRRISKPMSSTQTPSKSHDTVLKFTKNQFNICIGDVNGNVHVMALSEMPFSPNCQEAVLVEAINVALTTRPDILHTLRRLGPPFVSQEQTYDYKARLYRKLYKLYQNIT